MEAVLRRERALVGGLLAVIIALSWLYLWHLAAGMSSMNMTGVVLPMTAPWGAVDLALLFVMWTVMMVAMMAPTAAPMILTFVSVNQRRQAAGRPVVSAYVFLLGYVVVWTGFSAVATVAQWGLRGAALLSPGMALADARWGGLVLVAAGIFQWTPWKRACLSHCRSPLSFLMSGWREGTRGAFSMGLRHGTYCLGCCWILMALLFVVGVMNLMWVAALTAFVMAEKIAPAGQQIARVAGVALVLWGAFVVLAA